MLPRPKKRLGQHFLTDRHYLERIVAAIDPQPGEAMVEIGPGPGALTARLARSRRPPARGRDRPRRSPRACATRSPPDAVDVHEGDALEFDFAALPAPLRVVGNLPYNISTPILFHVAAVRRPRIRDCIFMLQKEVVDRMVARPGHRRLRPAVGDAAVPLRDGARCCRVPPGAFTPPPKVDSAVVRMVPARRRSPRGARRPSASPRSCRAAFSQRRKTLRNAVRALVDEAGFAAAGIDPGRRGETLSVHEFIALADTKA